MHAIGLPGLPDRLLKVAELPSCSISAVAPCTA